MARRKMKRNVRQTSKTDISVSDSDNEFGRPVKQLKSVDSSAEADAVSGPLSSTLQMEQSASDIESGTFFELSDREENENHYESFASFMELHSFASESEDEQMSQQQEDKGRMKSGLSIKNIAIKKESLDSSRNVGNTVDKPEDIMVLTVDSQQIELVALKPPTSVTLTGFVRVSVLVGSASVLGHRIKEGKSVKVFSTECTNLKKVTALESIHKLSHDELCEKIYKIIGFKDKDINFVNHLSSSTVVLVLERCFLPPALQFLELYYPVAVQEKWSKKGGRSLCSTQDEYAIEISDDDQVLASEINLIIKNSAKEGTNSGHRILVFGPKRSGKSSLLRYLINSLLKKKRAIYYLDTDPGQTEFTPPGVVSLSKVTEPLLGPPYSHQKQPEKMIFTGSITAQTSPPMYLKSILKLVDTFNATYEKEILFINTMGWLQGLGDVCFKKIVQIVSPTILVEFCPPEDTPSLTVEELPDNVRKFRIPSREPLRLSFDHKYLTPPDMRNFALLSYLGQCQKYHEEPKFLNAFRPVCVSWDSIAIYVMGKKVPPNRLIEAIHCSVIALCCVHESFMLKSDNPDLPMTLSDEPDNECIGFGLVRAIDETQHMLYIVTPLSPDRLGKVNALVKGNVMVPSEVICKQTILNVPLSYTDQSMQAATSSRKKVPKRAKRSFIHAST